MYMVKMVVFMVKGLILMKGRRIGMKDKWRDRIIDLIENKRRRIGEL